ncbi:MAG TPA: MYG1 family protein [Candidatus Paceibacterota bacterium]|nr:MYG1 family protein [Candidatus Paceibacterota bacterium]HPT17809.1 MYG1 family protein [Candidatus Paceibacterota bacterium]
MKFFNSLFRKKTKKLVTHSGSFHSDDIFACATICIALEKEGKSFEIIRTRDPKIIKSGDIVFDVGGIYNPDINRFDHHQIGGAKKRDNGIECSSFGLVWKKYGEKICGSKEVADFINKKLVMPVDAFDNGMDLVESKHEVNYYLVQNFFMSFIPSWKCRNEKTLLDGFLKAVKVAKELLLREISFTKDLVESRKEILRCYDESKDKRFIVLDKKYPWEEEMSKFAEPLFVIFPRHGGNWGAEGVLINMSSFKRRKYFPQAWAGLSDGELAKVSGVSDSVFCHRGIFMVVAKSKEGIIKLVEKALNE